MGGIAISGGNPQALKRAVVSLAASGNVVAAVAGRRVKVVAYSYQSRNDGMSVQLTDGNGGAALDQVWTLNAREGAISTVAIPFVYHFATSAGNALFAVLTGAGTVDIAVTYWDQDGS